MEHYDYQQAGGKSGSHNPAIMEWWKKGVATE